VSLRVMFRYPAVFFVFSHITPWPFCGKRPGD
jgi:hypothetical protein